MFEKDPRTFSPEYQNLSPEQKAMVKLEITLSAFVKAFENSLRRWERLIYPMMLVLALLAASGFYLIFSLTQDMSTMATNIDPEMEMNLRSMSDDMAVLTRHVAAMAESVATMVTAVSAMQESVAGMDGGVDRISTSVVAMEGHLATISGHMQTMDGSLAGVTGHMGSLDRTIGAMHQDIQGMNQSMGRMSQDMSRLGFDVNRMTRPESIMMPFLR